MSNTTISDLERDREIVELLLLLQPADEKLVDEKLDLNTRITALKDSENSGREKRSQDFWQSIADKLGKARTSQDVETLKTEVETYQKGLAESDPEWNKASGFLQTLQAQIDWLSNLEQVDSFIAAGDKQASVWTEESLKRAKNEYEKALGKIPQHTISTSPNPAPANESGTVDGSESLEQSTQAPGSFPSKREWLTRTAELERKIKKTDGLLAQLSNNSIEAAISQASEALEKVDLLLKNEMKEEAANSPKLKQALSKIRKLRGWHVTNEDTNKVHTIIEQARKIADIAGIAAQAFEAQITPPDLKWAEAVLAGETPEKPDESWVQQLEVAVSLVPDFKQVNQEHTIALEKLIEDQAKAFWGDIKSKKKKSSALERLSHLLHYTALSQKLALQEKPSITPTTMNINGMRTSGQPEVGGNATTRRRFRRPFSKDPASKGKGDVPLKGQALQDLAKADDIRDWLRTNDPETVWQQAVAYHPKAKGINRRFLAGWFAVFLLAAVFLGGFVIGQAQVATPTSPATSVAQVTETITPTLTIPTATLMPDIGATVVSALLAARPTLDAARPAETPVPDLAQTVVAAVLTAQATITPTTPVATATPDLVQTLVAAILTAQATVEAAQPTDTPTPPDNTGEGTATPIVTSSPTNIATLPESEATAATGDQQRRFYSTLEGAKTRDNSVGVGLLPPSFTVIGRDETSEYFYIQLPSDLVGWVPAEYVVFPEGVDPGQLPVRGK